MGLIILAAKIVLCESCHAHGVIVYGDGSKSAEFSTKDDALTEVSDAKLAGKIVDAEAEFLRDAIRSSKIPTERQKEAVHKVIDALQAVSSEEADRMASLEALPTNRTLH